MNYLLAEVSFIVGGRRRNLTRQHIKIGILLTVVENEIVRKNEKK